MKGFSENCSSGLLPQNIITLLTKPRMAKARKTTKEKSFLQKIGETVTHVKDALVDAKDDVVEGLQEKVTEIRKNIQQKKKQRTRKTSVKRSTVRKSASKTRPSAKKSSPKKRSAAKKIARRSPAKKSRKSR
jgi:hypothetical protein